MQESEQNGVPVLRMGFPTKVQPTLTSAIGGSDYIVEFPHLNASFPTQGSEDSKDVVEIQTNKPAAAVATTSSSVIGYQCPQCKCKVCNLPTICPVWANAIIHPFSKIIPSFSPTCSLQRGESEPNIRQHILLWVPIEIP